MGLNSKLELFFTCACIGANALCAGAIFCFPLLAAPLGVNLRLSQAQLSTIALAGMMGQYPFGPIWGMLADRCGPWACSLCASVLFALSFALFSTTVSAPAAATSSTTYLLLVFYFFLAGLGTVASYFSFIFSASKVFPRNSGFATGVVTAVFGFSPFVLSVIATTYFTDIETGAVNVAGFTKFLAMRLGLVHAISAIGLRAVPREGEPKPEDTEGASETSPLLASKTLEQRQQEEAARDSAFAVLCDHQFWMLTLIVVICIGSAEMVMTNIGTIAISLSTSTLVSAPLQVRLISASNTISRLITGPLADYLSPMSMSSSEAVVLPLAGARTMSRSVFVCSFAIIMTASYLWMAFGVSTESGIWALSLGIGASYGGLWTILPGLVADFWGTRHSGRNFGIVSYAPFLGTPLFTYLYASISDRSRGEETICQGAGCWLTTFRICAGATGLAAISSILLWRQRRAKDLI